MNYKKVPYKPERVKKHNFYVQILLYILGSNHSMVFVVRLMSHDVYYATPRAILISGVQQVSQTSCVRFGLYYMIGVSLIVRVPKCISTNDKYGTLLVITDGLGDAWHNVWLPLMVNDTCDAQLQFEVIYDIGFTLQSKISIGNILLEEKACMGNYYKNIDYSR